MTVCPQQNPVCNARLPLMQLCHRVNWLQISLGKGWCGKLPSLALFRDLALWVCSFQLIQRSAKTASKTELHDHAESKYLDCVSAIIEPGQ